MRVLVSYRDVLAILCLPFLLGCGSGDPIMPGTEEDQQVATVVAGLNDAATDQAMFESLFVAGKAPEERDKYFSAVIEVVGVPLVDGDTATAVVKISQAKIQSEGRGSALKPTRVGEGQVTWTLKKQGDEWKIEDAPLP